eukprot:1159450-Pelagomonas_calceolata.AAC.3
MPLYGCLLLSLIGLTHLPTPYRSAKKDSGFGFPASKGCTVGYNERSSQPRPVLLSNLQGYNPLQFGGSGSFKWWIVQSTWPTGVLFMYHPSHGIITDIEAEQHGVPALAMAHIGLPWAQVAQIRGLLRAKVEREAKQPKHQAVPLQSEFGCLGKAT